jgi:hypothetical protein
MTGATITDPDELRAQFDDVAKNALADHDVRAGNSCPDADRVAYITGDHLDIRARQMRGSALYVLARFGVHRPAPARPTGRPAQKPEGGRGWRGVRASA